MRHWIVESLLILALHVVRKDADGLRLCKKLREWADAPPGTQP